MYYKESAFRRFLLDRLAMTIDEAYKVLGLPKNTTDKELIKKKYRQLAIQNHPDRGGDTEKMKKINEAKDKLDTIKKSPSFDKEKWEQQKETRDKQKAENIKKVQKYCDKVKKIINSNKEKYLNHFKKLTNEDYKMLVKEQISERTFVLDYKFKAANSQFNLHLSFYFDYGEVKDVKIIYWEATFFSNQKEYRMHRSRFESTKDESIITKPEIFFPDKKMKTILKKTKTTEDKPLKRKDAIAILEREYGAKFHNKDFYKVPITKDTYILVYRTTMLKQGAWTINGLYEGYRRTHVPPKFRSYIETFEEIDYTNFKDLLTDIDKMKRGQFKWSESKR